MEYLSVSAAQRCVLEEVATLGVETVRLEQSLGRVLAEDIRANRDLPPYDVSAMDGFAVRSADLCGPVDLEVVEDIRAGDMPTVTVQAGQCARIMTGAPVPQGADAVVRVEDSETLPDGRVRFVKQAPSGLDIRLRGEGMRSGDVVLAAGTEITPGVAGVLATVKRAQLQVYRLPRVAILSTGNELEGIDDPVDPDKIPDANSYALMAQVQALGMEPVLLGIARDDPVELERYLRQGLEYDMLLVSGGTSVGVHDYVRPTVEALGVRMKFWRVAMKPGHPLAFGVLQRPDNTRAMVFGLPGNPVSSMVCFEEFVLLALRGIMGHAHLHRRTVKARLAHPIKMRPGRTEFVRVLLSRDGEGYVATSTGNQSSGALLSMARADGLLVVSSDSSGLAASEQVTVQLLDGAAFQDQMGFRE
jgi:molybdopterin molybdotransferase